jgi:hypothetical protein
MRHLLEIALACSAVFGGGSACAQGTVGNGTFQNLNFEAATIPTGATVGIFPTSEALPGWTALVGDSPQATVGYNDYSLNGESVAVVGPSLGAIDGNYSVFLLGSQFPGFGAPDVSVAQTGLIPAGAKSIQFLATGIQTPFSLTLNGSPVALLNLGNSGGILAYGGNISSFAGTTATLQISAGNLGGITLDDISFSSQSVPEPGTLALASLGGLALVPAARKKRR